MKHSDKPILHFRIPTTASGELILDASCVGAFVTAVKAMTQDKYIVLASPFEIAVLGDSSPIKSVLLDEITLAEFMDIYGVSSEPKITFEELMFGNGKDKLRKNNDQ